MAKDHEVGYGRPPLHARFKPGQSGNPKGRPRRRPDLLAEIMAELMQLVTITANGRRERVTKLRALVRSIYVDALKGDRHARELMLKHMANFAGVTTGEVSGFRPEDAEIIQRHHARYGRRLSRD